MNPNLTPEEQKKVNAGMQIIARLGGLKRTAAQQRARKKNIKKALKIRHGKALKAA